jgi:hypothetical protein
MSDQEMTHNEQDVFTKDMRLDADLAFLNALARGETTVKCVEAAIRAALDAMAPSVGGVTREQLDRLNDDISTSFLGTVHKASDIPIHVACDIVSEGIDRLKDSLATPAPQTVASVEELEALPVGTPFFDAEGHLLQVVEFDCHDEGPDFPCISEECTGRRRWYDGLNSRSGRDVVRLPATVLTPATTPTVTVDPKELYRAVRDGEIESRNYSNDKICALKGGATDEETRAWRKEYPHRPTDEFVIPRVEAVLRAAGIEVAG